MNDGWKECSNLLLKKKKTGILIAKRIDRGTGLLTAQTCIRIRTENLEAAFTSHKASDMDRKAVYAEFVLLKPD